jgi:flagellar hook-basal body complex protein FliE
MVEAIAAMQGLLSELASLAGAASAPDADSSAAAPSASGGTSFAALFDAAVNRLDGDVADATTKAAGFASGSSNIPLSDVMVSLEEANLGLELASNVRDKVAAAYSSVMGMQL